jgi:hypothetical protein
MTNRSDDGWGLDPNRPRVPAGVNPHVVPEEGLADWERELLGVPLDQHRYSGLPDRRGDETGLTSRPPARTVDSEGRGRIRPATTGVRAVGPLRNGTRANQPSSTVRGLLGDPEPAGRRYPTPDLGSDDDVLRDLQSALAPTWAHRSSWQHTPPAATPDKPDFTDVGQPKSTQFGTAYKSHSKYGTSESVEVGWRGPGPDPSRAPYRNMDHWEQEDVDTRPHAWLSMTRHADRYYGEHDQRDATYDYDYNSPHGQQQGTLFNAEEASPWKVNEMYASKEGAHMAPTLAAMAAEHSLKTSGKMPKASNDLSRYSTRLVHKLSDLGVIDAPKNEHRNNIDFAGGARNAAANVGDMVSRSQRKAVSDGIGDEVSQQALESASHMLRGVLRGARQQRNATEKWTGETLTGGGPINVRTTGGLFEEWKHNKALDDRADNPPKHAAPQDGLW